MLIVLTNGYPYGGEPFLQSESPYLPKDTIFFAVSASSTQKNDDEIKDSFIIGDGKATIGSFFYAVRGIFDKDVYRELISLNKRNKLSAKSIRRLFSTYGSAKLLCKRIVRILEKKYHDRLSEDIIIYCYWMDVHAVIATFLKRRYSNAKAVSRCHGYDLYEYRHESGYIPFRHLVLNALDRIMPISSNGKEYLLDMYGQELNEKIQVCRLGTKDCGINPCEKTGKYTIVTCSSITKVKRLELLISALCYIKIPVRWVHFGDGDQGESIRKLAAGLLDEKKNIEYIFMGKKDKDDILRYYSDNHIDIFVNTSESEGIPVSIMEAMSFGIPVIASDVGGTGEIVKSGINGRLFHKEEKPEVIAEILSEFAAMDDSEIAVFRKKARMSWAEEYRDEVNFSSFLHLLEDV